VPNALDMLNQENQWRKYIYDLVLNCGYRIVRHSASEQFLLIALKCSNQQNRSLQFFIQMLFTQLHCLNGENAQQSHEYFFLLCRLLNYAYCNDVPISNTEALLRNEIKWLKKVKSSKAADTMSNETTDIDETLLDGHLNITKELLLFQTSEKKYFIGCDPNGDELINDLVENFVFSASYLFKKCRDSLLLNQLTSHTTIEEGDTSSKTTDTRFENLLSNKSLKSICETPVTTMSALDLLVSLCTGCLPNLNFLINLLFKLFYPSLKMDVDNTLVSQLPNEQLTSIGLNCTNESNLLLLSNDCTINSNEWEYAPPIGQRPFNGFVGLKNAGATCYMNSVLQQLFMIKTIRDFILTVDIADEKLCKQNDMAAFDDADDNNDSSIILNQSITNLNSFSNVQTPSNEADIRKEYNITIFKHLQMIFGHLSQSKMQYYIPKAFWRQFRFGNEKVNLREQHDAVEFFNSLVDCIDESMKSLGREQICSKVIGGLFADQKICKGCPHRYSRDESFTLLSVDVKHCQRLTESLEQYVKGDLLEGPNAYHCDKCNKKVDTVKRTCIKRLPNVLVIQLKRFDYDWEREIAVKFNEYFEFPRLLDMEPYTVQGIARLDKLQKSEQTKRNAKLRDSNLLKKDEDIEEVISNEQSNYDNDEELLKQKDDEPESSIYSDLFRLVGVVVHSGQANGGHYYSFIQSKPTLNTNSTESKKSNEFSDDGKLFFIFFFEILNMSVIAVTLTVQFYV
jgi:ubiquitin carboxyl-terminal hydrolase 9/24